jgi:hypothetical protein
MKMRRLVMEERYSGIRFPREVGVEGERYDLRGITGK